MYKVLYAFWKMKIVTLLCLTCLENDLLGINDFILLLLVYIRLFFLAPTIFRSVFLYMPMPYKYSNDIIS